MSRRYTLLLDVDLQRKIIKLPSSHSVYTGETSTNPREKKKQAGRYTEVTVERTFTKQEIPAGPAFLFLIFATTGINRCSVL